MKEKVSCKSSGFNPEACYDCRHTRPHERNDECGTYCRNLGKKAKCTPEEDVTIGEAVGKADAGPCASTGRPEGTDNPTTSARHYCTNFDEENADCGVCLLANCGTCPGGVPYRVVEVPTCP